MGSNFDFLAKYWPDMAQIGKLAELYLHTDSRKCICTLGLLAERAAREICAFERPDLSEQATHADLLRALKYEQLLPRRIDTLFYTLRKAKDGAAHMDIHSAQQARTLVRTAFLLCGWFMEVYGDWDFRAPEFCPPEDHSQDPEFAAAVQSAEQTVIALLAAPEEVRTSVSGTTRDDRSAKAREAAEKLPLTQEETGAVPVRLDLAVLPVLNYAMQQNGAVAVQSVTIENNTDTPIENAELTITASPAFALPFSRHIDLLPANKAITISRPELVLDGAYLAGMTEKTTGILHIRLKTGKETLVWDNAEVTVLAFDEWHGLGLYPELLSTFVTPNHPELARIIARATEYLGQWTGDTSMDAYQSQDPNRVLSQAAAIFTAIKELAIAYVVPPASFERAGQRVRLCDTVLQQKLGTCLDLTLLYASCLEAVGLRPLLITTEGHIFTGLWLDEQMFPECVQDDVCLITKRLASGVNEIAVVETTCVTTGKDLSFDDARRAAERSLSTQQVDYIIDVHRARMSHISPLPQRIPTGAGWTVEHEASFNKENLTAPRKLDDTILMDESRQEESLPKKIQWERKLLDLGMRNTLINLRLTKTQLPILTGSLDALENALSDGSDFSIMPKPADLAMEEFSFDALHQMGAAGIIQAEFENKRLRSVLTEAELAKTVKQLYRTAKTALEENGANTLYLALGMLRWYETRRSTKARYAPIILLPIEMVRKSAAQGYVIRLRDEDPQMNVTLLEKLKQDFGILVSGVDPLPEDEHGIDIRKVLTYLRKAVMDQPRWDVLETASIGIFSFSQFVMWNDIRHRTDDLMRNKIVRSLMDGKLAWEAQPLEIGQRVNENNVLLPMPADASQLYAIQAACSGESFVLHGPPGTGKSQTITSLIANALAQGKQVLFVAEKMAALEVVQKRLDQIGIGPFCLELHSNKSRKKDVLDQLRQASEVTKAQTAEQYAAKARQIADLRAELDGYARQLHQPLPCGSDLYSLISDYEACKAAQELAPFDTGYLRTLTPDAIDRHHMVIERLVAAGREVGHPHDHPLQRVGGTQYTQNLRSSLPSTVEAYEAALHKLAEHTAVLLAPLGQAQPGCFRDLERLSLIAEHMACWYGMPQAWTRTECPRLYFDEITQMTRHYRNVSELEQHLLRTFRPEILTLNGQQLYAEFVQVSSQWFLPKMMGINKLVKQLNLFAHAPVDKAALQTHLTVLRNYHAESAAAADLFRKYGQDLGALYQGDGTDWAAIASLAEAAQASAQALYDLSGSYSLMHDHCGKPALRNAVMGLRDNFAAAQQAKDAFDRLLGIVPQSQENWLDAQLRLCGTILDHAPALREWMAYNEVAQEADRLGLSNVTAAYAAGAEHDALLLSYRKTLLQGLISDAIDSSGELNRFSGTVFNKKIQQFKQLDEQWRQLSQQEVYCRLASKVPNFTREAAHSSELGILQRCIKSGGRGTSIRKLFDQIPNLLPRLCPCMLMSPISAAQYLDPGREPFDIVVFDEASQLPTCKAVGVLARGNDAIIVGDPKQMPPTAFFATNTVDEDNLEIEDLESILDDCLALNMPQSHLLWHYRSRHESLIAFSNSRFYENKLFTFPSVNDRESKVRLVPVDGVFLRGKSRVNQQEAQAVVDELRRRCHDPALSGQSVGVVTFNISQQNLIDDLLSEACAQDPLLEKWVFGSEEPVFIKNLENVQGDERDVILFSIGYGPDEQGKVYMNFGPLNRDGGWRRLNVAVSRARCEMVVFSTLRADQIDLNRTKAEGVAALRSFLEYAAGRALAVEESSLQPSRQTHDGMAQAICRVLGEAGYETDLAVGRSEYRIDIGVVDPRDPECYLLGIMTDGPSYGAAKTTRDRELAQIGVLNGLGWNILRVWSMDWWDNSEKEQKRILKKLSELQKEPQQPETAPVRIAAPAPLAQQTPAQPDAADAPAYKAAVLTAKALTAEEFTEPRHVRNIQKRLNQVIKAEAPISAPALIKRVVQSYGISRAGSRIQSHMTGILQSMDLKSTQQADTVFYWQADQNPDAYTLFRVSGEGSDHRDVRDVAVQETANAIYAVLYEQVSMAQEDLLREAARKLGYTRLGGNVLSALEGGIDYALSQGAITLGSNGTYILSAGGTARAEATLKHFQ